DVKKTESDSAPPAGAISGRIVLKGEVPPTEIAIKRGADIRDAEVCAAIDLYKDDLVIDPETKGIANVFIFMKTKPEGVKFDPPAQKKLLMDQKNCRFVPHAMIVRTDQIVEVISSDNCSHNLHTNPIRGAAMNVLMAANTPEGKGVEVQFGGPEIVPIKVNCDIHSWMEARWLIVDHPYAGMTNEKGEFTIDTAGLPDGEYEFRINHERSGWLEKSLMVNVKDGAADLGTMEYELSTFAEE
ncbi:MAG TPA: hypothetical protein VMM56_08220, partial [Planctomycetaceae bacterium]|nr:hypothetical protein [Planctomycetaceae bacterium]